MANYLTPAGNAIPVTVSPRSRDDIMVVNDMHRMKIYNNAGTIAFSGFIPPDFSISLAANWDAPFANTSLSGIAGQFGSGAGAVAGTIETGIKGMGGSLMNKLLSAQVWSTPSYLILDLPIFVDAYTDTKTEVIDNIVKMLSLVAPSETDGFMLVPPGPVPAMTIMQEIAGSDKKAGSMTDVLKDNSNGEAFTVDIGKFLSISPCVVKNVVTSLESTLEDGTGNPMACDFILQVSSYFAVSRQDIKKWFNPGLSTGGV